MVLAPAFVNKSTPESDRDAGLFTMRLRFPNDFRIAPHTHSAFEHVTATSILALAISLLSVKRRPARCYFFFPSKALISAVIPFARSLGIGNVSAYCEIFHDPLFLTRTPVPLFVP